MSVVRQVGISNWNLNRTGARVEVMFSAPGPHSVEIFTIGGKNVIAAKSGNGAVSYSFQLKHSTLYLVKMSTGFALALCVLFTPYGAFAAFLKNVFIDTVPGRKHYRLVETQVLQLDNSLDYDNWRSFVYVWDEGQTEGTLNPVFFFYDFFSNFNVYPGGVGTPAENFRMFHIEGVTFDLDYTDGVPAATGLIYEQATSSWMTEIGGIYLIEPGAPEKSILHYRTIVRTADLVMGRAIPEQMPFSNATIYADSLADTVISDWINSITGISRQSQTGSFSRPVLSRNFLNIQMSVDGREVTSVNLYDVNGNAIRLLRQTELLYEVSEPLKPGLYIAEINGNSYKYVVQ